MITQWLKMSRATFLERILGVPWTTNSKLHLAIELFTLCPWKHPKDEEQVLPILSTASMGILGIWVPSPYLARPVQTARCCTLKSMTISPLVSSFPSLLCLRKPGLWLLGGEAFNQKHCTHLLYWIICLWLNNGSHCFWLVRVEVKVMFEGVWTKLPSGSYEKFIWGKWVCEKDALRHSRQRETVIAVFR